MKTNATKNHRAIITVERVFINAVQTSIDLTIDGHKAHFCYFRGGNLDPKSERFNALEMYSVHNGRQTFLGYATLERTAAIYRALLAVPGFEFKAFYAMRTSEFIDRYSEAIFGKTTPTEREQLAYALGGFRGVRKLRVDSYAINIAC